MRDEGPGRCLFFRLAPAKPTGTSKEPSTPGPSPPPPRAQTRRGGSRGGAGAGGAAQQPGTLPPSPGSAGPAQESRKEPCYGRPLQIHPAPAPRPSKSAVIHPSAVAAPASLPLFRYPPLFSSPCLMAESIVTRLFADPLVTCCVTLPASLCPSPHSYPTALSAMPAPGLRFSLFRLPSD